MYKQAKVLLFEEKSWNVAINLILAVCSRVLLKIGCWNLNLKIVKVTKLC